MVQLKHVHKHDKFVLFLSSHVSSLHRHFFLYFMSFVFMQQQNTLERKSSCSAVWFNAQRSFPIQKPTDVLPQCLLLQSQLNCPGSYQDTTISGVMWLLQSPATPLPEQSIMPLMETLSRKHVVHSIIPTRFLSFRGLAQFDPRPR
jgi:hypothetical protein